MAGHVEVAGSTPADSSPPVPPELANQELTKHGSVERIAADPSKGIEPKKEEKPSDRPEWLKEKFKSVEDQAKAYAELEKKLGEKSGESKPAPAQPDATKIVQDAGLDMGKLQAEFASTGQLSEETYKSLEAKGIPKATVDSYIEGQKAKANEYNASLAESVGGKESLGEIYKWAAVNLSPEEINAANTALTSGNLAAATLVLSGLQTRFAAATGTEPSLVRGEGAPVAGVQPFRSSEEVVQAMSDKRYKTDEAYRKDVAKRLAVSQMFSVRSS